MFIYRLPFLNPISWISKCSYTKILHYRPEGGSNYTSNTLNKLNIKSIGVDSPSLNRNGKKIYKIIYEEAFKYSCNSSINQDIVEKIVLSMALRIYGEKYMYNEIKNKVSLNAKDYDKMQFGNLLGIFKKSYYKKDREKAVKVLDLIGILTPMEIHINGFAYEPLIDYSIVRLRALFKELIALMPKKLIPNHP